MRITICGSMAFAREMMQTQKVLERMGHTCYLPDDVEGYIGRGEDIKGEESAQKKNCQRSHPSAL